MAISRFLLGTATLSLVAVVQSQATIEIGAFPTMSVADGRSTITVSASLRMNDGRLVPDGTRVVFTTDKGAFRESVVETRNGVARAILQAGSEPGFAKVTASAITFKANATMDYEYVADRSLLSSANEFIKVTSPNDLRYSMDMKTLEATSPDQASELTFRDITIVADQIQLNVPTYEVRAKNAVISFGNSKQEVKVSELYFRLNSRMGYGSTTYMYRPSQIQPLGQGFHLVQGEERETFGVAEIRPGSVKQPVAEVRRDIFNFRDIQDSVTIIAAKNVVAYPRKEIQFQKADVYVGGTRLMRVPLYRVSVFTSTPVLTDQVVKINDNQLSIDYPYYLDLAPGRTSLLRLSMGKGGGRGLAANRGIFLNYEMNWNKGDDFQGDMVVQSLGRKDWGIGVRQYWRMDPQTDLTAQLDFPAHSSLYGSINFNKQFGGFSLSSTASDARSVRGVSFKTQQYLVSLEKNPVKVGKLPLNFTYGLTGSSLTAESNGFTTRQSSAGLRTALRMNPLYLDTDTSLTGSLSVSKLFGKNAPPGLATIGNLTLGKNIRGGGIALGYDYYADGFSDEFLGKHQLSMRGNLFYGNLAFNSFLLKGVDKDRMNFQMDASYRLNRDWRLSYAYTYDRLLGESFLDYYFVVGYRIGFREFGLTWSNRTKRFGFQVLGTVLD